MSKDLTQQVKALATEVGYVDCGVTTAEPFSDYVTILREKMRRFPAVRPLLEHQLKREEPRRTAPWAQAIVVCVHYYGKYRLPPGLSDYIGRSYLADRRCKKSPENDLPARFSRGLKELGLRIKRGGVPDRAAAVRAGVARIGRNGFAYADRYGSWVNIETWRVDAALRPDRPAGGSPCPDDCQLCREACPSGAVVEPCGIRMDRCIAWLTYEAPFPIEDELWSAMGPWIYGCDICQEICPLNRGKWRAEMDAAWISEVADSLTPQALADMNQDEYENVVHPRFWYIARDDLARWHANACRSLEWRAGKDRSNATD